MIFYFLFFLSIEVCGYRKRSDAKIRVTKKKERKRMIDRERFGICCSTARSDREVLAGY